MIHIRSCSGLEELEACVQLQVDVWGYADGDVIPRRVFLVAQKIGGQVLGAFDTDRAGAAGLSHATQGDAGSMVGFALALPGVKTGSGQPVSYLHSHMLAVREGYRNAGIGRRLKLAQREDALQRGITRMEWTFDPLEIKNAHLNLHRLGAIVRRYEPNFYGSSSSRLQGGLPTDRLVAEWWMDSPRVHARLRPQTAELPPQAGLDRAEQGAAGLGSAVDLDAGMEVVVPAAISQWKADAATRDRAAAVQTRNREHLQQAFAQGLAIVDYRLDADGSGRFLLAPWNEP